MSPAFRISLTLVLLAVSLQTALSIQCYRCESDSNENCGENFNADAVPLDDCDQEILPRYLRPIVGSQKAATGCAKIDTERYGTPVVIRSCYFGDVADSEQGCTYNPEDAAQPDFNCEICEEDGCNGSTKSMATKILVIIPVLFSIIFVKYFLHIFS